MELELNAQKREITGKKVRTLREKGVIPAVVYGAGLKPVSIQIESKQFEKVFKIGGESTIIKLKTGEEIKNVLIHDIARDPVKDNIIHIDFYEVRMDQVITTEVPLVFEGESPAVKNLEGTLVKNLTEVEIEALPKDLPHEIKVDISILQTFDDHIKISDLKLSQGVKILEDPEEVVVLVTPPRTEEELKELEEKPAEKIEEAEAVAEKEEKVKETPAVAPTEKTGKKE